MFARNFSLLSAISVLIVYACLNVYFGQNAYVEIHDNLDSSHAWLAALYQHELFFAGPDVDVPMLSGMGRDYFMSEFQLGNLVYYFFPPFEAHIISFVLKLCIGFLSFFLLAREIFGNTTHYQIAIPVVAAAYALLPGYENLYIAQASLPLAAFLYIRFLKSPSPWVFIAVFFYPALSEFPRYGFFLCAILGLIFVCSLFFDRKIAKRTLLVLTIFSLGYILTDYRLFRLMLLSGEETIRSEFILSTGSFWEELKKGFLYSQHYSQSKHLYVILPTALVGFFALMDFQSFRCGLLCGIKENFKKNELKILFSLFIVVFVFSIIHGLYAGTELSNLLKTIVPQLAGFNFSRFIWLSPLAWHLIFLISLVGISRRISPFLCGILGFSHMILIPATPSYGNDLARTFLCTYQSECSSNFTYKQFYSTQLFNEIKKSINYQEELVVAFGFHPSILTFNGFSTADGYHNAYSKEYKKEFRELIYPVLEASDRYANYFDHWGGRAYLFSPEVSYNPSTNVPAVEARLPVDQKKLREMEIRYVLSFYRLGQNSKNVLMPLEVFSNKESPYRVYVYEVRP